MRLFIGTTFYTSLLYKKAPGTISSLAAFIFFYFFLDLTLRYRLFLVGIIGFLHFVCFPVFERNHKNDDPPIYTLDESFAIALLSIFILSLHEWVIAFIAFRFFDILKPLGIKRFERLSQIPAVIRNIGDDTIAALYTYFVIIVYRYVF